MLEARTSNQCTKYSFGGRLVVNERVNIILLIALVTASHCLGLSQELKECLSSLRARWTFCCTQVRTKIVKVVRQLIDLHSPVNDFFLCCGLAYVVRNT